MSESRNSGVRGVPAENSPAHPDTLAQQVADTLPGAPAPVRLEDDELFATFSLLCATRTVELHDRQWDNLAHVQAFAEAARLGAVLVARHPDEASRRAVVHGLWSLVPPAARGHRPLPFRALPDEVAARAPDYRLLPGDMPRIAPIYCAFPGAIDVAASLFVPGAGPFLVPRSLCPTAARGAATAVVLAEAEGKAASSFRARVPRSIWSASPDSVDVRTGADGRPLLTAEGRPQPLVVGTDVLSAWLFTAGPDARGLDLRNHDDRALLLVFARLLRAAEVRGRSVFSWLEDKEAPLEVRGAVVTACVEAAVEAVAAFTADALACRIVLRSHPDDGGWPQRAAAILDDTGLCHDVTPRVPPAGFARDIVWLDAFLAPGYAAGRLSSLAAGRAFARLATSVLAPLGVLPSSGMKDGSGDVLLQRLRPSSASSAFGSANDDGFARAEGLARDPPLLVSFGRPAGLTRVLWQAWREGAGCGLPDPRNHPRHDVHQMAAWLSFFLEGVGAG